MFKIIKKDKNSKARLSELKTANGRISGPFFMPIATKAAVKSLDFQDIKNLNPQILLSNTYHLMLRPGEKLIKKNGGLHEFMKWSGPILTDSGGFQVFSLGKLRKITNKGAMFQSHIDGQKILLTPERSIQIQLDLNSDIIMAFDECVELPAKKDYLEKSINLTTEWAKRCKVYFEEQEKKLKNIRTKEHKNIDKKQKKLLFGIVQGGLEKDLRLRSAKALTEIGFNGYAIGGLSVGETAQEMNKVLDYTVSILPEDKPRYLMGVGRPENIVAGVKRGVDMFDCVIPTREARHGRLYLFKQENKKKRKQILKSRGKGFYQTINILNRKFATDFSVINPNSKFEVLRTYSKAYLRHLFVTNEPLALRLSSLNNLEFYLELMKRIRDEIRNS